MTIKNWHTFEEVCKKRTGNNSVATLYTRKKYYWRTRRKHNKS